MNVPLDNVSESPLAEAVKTAPDESAISALATAKIFCALIAPSNVRSAFEFTEISPLASRFPAMMAPNASTLIFPLAVITPLVLASPAVAFSIRLVPIVPLFRVATAPVMSVVVALTALSTTARPDAVTEIDVPASNVPVSTVAAFKLILASLSISPAPATV